jgi:hypothetical protein
MGVGPVGEIIKRPRSRKYRIQCWSLAQQKNRRALPSHDSPCLSFTNQDNLDGLLGEESDMRRLIVNTFGFQCQMIPVVTTLAGFGKGYNAAGTVGGILLAVIGFLIGAFIAGDALTLLQCAESLDRLVQLAEVNAKADDAANAHS